MDPKFPALKKYFVLSFDKCAHLKQLSCTAQLINLHDSDKCLYR